VDQATEAPRLIAKPALCGFRAFSGCDSVVDLGER
jgi:hypothetical protein